MPFPMASATTATKQALTAAPATVPEEPDEHLDRCAQNMESFLASAEEFSRKPQANNFVANGCDEHQPIPAMPCVEVEDKHRTKSSSIRAGMRRTRVDKLQDQAPEASPAVPSPDDAQAPEAPHYEPPGWDFIASMEFQQACAARPITKKELSRLEQNAPDAYANAREAESKEWAAWLSKSAPTGAHGQEREGEEEEERRPIAA